jgi:hypothetical protein
MSLTRSRSERSRRHRTSPSPELGGRSKRHRRSAAGAAGLKLAHPRLDRGFAKAPVSAEANVRDASGASLSPDPLGVDAEPLGNLLGSQEPVHRLSSTRRTPNGIELAYQILIALLAII